MMSDSRLLGELLSRGPPVALSDLARRLNAGVGDVDAALARLENCGCVFDTTTPGSVALLASGLGAWAEYLEAAGHADRGIAVYQSTASTQDAARRIGEDRALVIADHQSAGRGRMGRRWIAPPGSAVLLSRVVAGSSRNVDRLTFSTAVAVARTLDRWLGPVDRQASIKWPNDVLVDGAKIAGILVERHASKSSTSAATIGIGLNVGLSREQAPAQLPDPVTSLQMCGAATDRLAVLVELIEQLDAVIDAISHDDDPGPLIDEWRRRSTLIDRRVCLESEGEELVGTVIDLDPAEGLILRTDDGQPLHIRAASASVKR